MELERDLALWEKPDSSNPYDPVETVTSFLVEHNCCMLLRHSEPTLFEFDREFWYLGPLKDFLMTEAIDFAQYTIEISITYEEEEQVFLVWFSEMEFGEVLAFVDDLLGMEEYSIRFIEVIDHFGETVVHFRTFENHFVFGCGYLVPVYYEDE